MDGMDQNHCSIRYCGTQQKFSNPLTQAILGVKQHGVGLTLYRTINTVKKGANLTIYCLLDQIEKWRQLRKQYPEVLFVQCDGGSENANLYVLAVLELLCVKRFIKKIYFTRLPTRHTHEYIDACFGTIWRTWYRGKACLTLDDYSNGIVESFIKEKSLNASVVEVLVVPDYTSYLRYHIDQDLGNMHKSICTMHQWRFEAVSIISPLFPFGVKTTWRA